jgi:hypothetical protein
MRKLPVISALKHIITTIATHWRAAARFGLPWMALSAVLSVWSIHFAPQSLEQPPVFEVGPADFIVVAVNLLASSSIAVSWNRFILLDSLPSEVMPFRVDHYVWLFLIRNVGIGLLCIIPILMLSSAFDALPIQLLPIWLGLSLLLLVIMVRMMICLPAVAIGRKDYGIREALLESKGSTLPILGLVIAVVILILSLFFIMVIMITALLTAVPSLAKPAMIVLGIPIQLAIIMLSTTMQTTLYGYFGENREF